MTWGEIRAYVEELIPDWNWSPWEIVDNIWDTLIDRIKWWFEEQEEWLYKLGERILDRVW